MLRRNSLLGGINSVKLPTGYTKLEYIESDGNHYIDTGFVPNQDTRVKMSILASGLSGETYAYGARNSAGSNAFLCALEPSAITFGYAIQYRAYEGVIDGRYDIDQNKNIMTVNGTELSGNYVESFSSESNLTLFGRNTAGSVENLSAIKLYSCQIYDNGVKVRDYVPCTNFYGKSGLYDTVNKVFYPLIPAGYTLLEYLESDGESYIDTGFKSNQDTRVVMHIRPLVDTLSANAFLFGGMQGDSSRFSVFYHKSKNSWAVDYTSDANRQYFSNTKIDQDLYIDYNKNVCNFNDEQVVFDVSEFQSTVNMILLGVDFAGEKQAFIKARIYSCQIYDNDVLVRDYIPVINSSGEQGLYDLVNNVFYAFKQAMTFTWSIVSGSWVKGTQSSAVDGVKYTSVSPGANGSTRLRCTFSGVTSITFNCVYNGESNYDYLTVGSIDTACTRNSYGTTLKGTSGTAKNITFSCTTASHYVEFCYSKDGSVDTSPDCAVVYIKSAS